MSRELISRSADLRRLREEGYDIRIVRGFLVVSSIPYVTPEKQVEYGQLVCPLALAGEVTLPPPDHVVRFAGKTPSYANGTRLDKVIHSSGRQELMPDLWVDFTFSSKPAGGYPDYYAKMTTYIKILVAEARSIDETVTATPFRVVETEDEDSVFLYTDNASSRAEIGMINQKLALNRVSIVGLGGTGSYILDLVAKTPVRQIDLFDGDRLLQHNAFRSPGAPSVEELREVPFKVDYWAGIYSKMRRGVVPHLYYMDEQHLAELDGSDFVFLAFDGGANKKALVQYLEDRGIAFIDVGMGLYKVGNDCLGGQVRTVASTPQQREHVHARGRIPFVEPSEKDEYEQNIQIADLNALNAVMAVIKWKKLAGFYQDLEGEHFSLYQVNGNCLINEDRE